MKNHKLKFLFQPKCILHVQRLRPYGSKLKGNSEKTRELFSGFISSTNLLQPLTFSNVFSLVWGTSSYVSNEQFHRAEAEASY